MFFRLSPGIATSSGNWLWKAFGDERTGGAKTSTGYTFDVTALWNSAPFEIRIVPRPDAEPEVMELIALTIKAAATVGGLGAKTQYGFGQVSLNETADFQRLVIEAKKRLDADSRNPAPQGEAFTLASTRFFSVRYHLQNNPYAAAGVDIGQPPARFDNAYVPCAFDIRYKYESRNPRSGTGMNKGLRPEIAGYFDSARDICGYVDRDGTSRASRIHVSHLFRASNTGYYFKVWADTADSDALLNVTYHHLMQRFKTSGISAERLS